MSSSRRPGSGSRPRGGATASTTAPAAPTAPAPSTAPGAALPVARRQALPLRPRNVPALTRATQDARIEALRNQLRYPYAIERTILVRHLTTNAWDVNRAAQAFQQADEQARNSPGQIYPADYQSAPSRTVGGSRLRVARALNNRLGQSVQPTFGRSNATIFTLLHDNGFSLDRAAEELADRQRRGLDLDDIVDRVASVRLPRPNQMQQDERLAMFISLTSTNSVSAAARMLRRVHWDYARVVDVWAALGYVPKKKSERSAVTNDDTSKAVSRVVDAERPFSRLLRRLPDGNDPCPDDSDKTASSSLSESDDGYASDESAVSVSGYESTSSLGSQTFIVTRKILVKSKHIYGTGENDRKGYLIDQDRNPAKSGCPDPTKLKIESLRKGKYRCKWFPGSVGPKDDSKPFRWNDSDHDSDAAKIEFDWNDKKHISKLNRWREEEFRRITAERTKPSGTKFADAELEWIWDKFCSWTEEKFYEMAGQRAPVLGRRDPVTNPVKFSEAKLHFGNKDNFPKRVPRSVLDGWATEFNQQFGGRRSIQNPRDIRVPATLNPLRPGSPPTTFPAGTLNRPRSPPESFPAPRPDRGGSSIDIMSHRIKRRTNRLMLSTINNFRVKYQPAHTDSESSGDSD